LGATIRNARAIVWLALLASVAWLQDLWPQSKNTSSPSDAASVSTAIASVKSGRFYPADLEIIAEARAVAAIPTLEDQFSRTEDLSAREKIANVLVRLGDKNEGYWNFIVKQARNAVDNDAPSVLHYDEHGSVSDPPSREFVEWATAHHLPMQQAMADQLEVYPGAIFDLGTTGDSRAIPLLRRALKSQNLLIESEAALGLAKIKDKTSIHLIIEACKRAPAADVAMTIALSLIYFDDAEAQRAVERYVPKDVAVESRKARAAGQGPFGEKELSY
jgi:HEAT repeat protein